MDTIKPIVQMNCTDIAPRMFESETVLPSTKMLGKIASPEVWRKTTMTMGPTSLLSPAKMIVQIPCNRDFGHCGPPEI